MNLNENTTETDLLETTNTVNEQLSVAEFKDAVQPDKVEALVTPVIEPSDDLTNLKRFLAKPRLVLSGNLTGLGNTNILDPAVSRDFATFFSEFNIITKLYNFYGIRFTMCAKITMNVTPFDSGQVALTYTPPLFGSRSASLTPRFCFMTLPGVDMDLAEVTSGEVRVPYYSPKRFLPVSTVINNDQLGTFSITSPVDNIFAGNSSEYKLYYWIEDVELLYPTNLASVDQRIAKRMQWIPQGPSKENIGGGQIVLSQNNYDSNYQVTKQAVPACLNVVNKPYNNGSVDDFSDLFRTPGPIGVFQISTAQPFSEQFIVSPQPTELSKWSRLALATTFFKFWSGSINYRIKVFATKFHNMRFQVAYIPGDPIIAVPSNLDDFWNIIWDIRESSELEFSVPYTSDVYALPGTYANGTIVIRSLNAFQAPDQVSQSPKMLVTSWAGDDFSFLAPYSALQLSSAPVTTREWEPQGPKQISDKHIAAPENYINESHCSMSQLVSKYSRGVGVSASFSSARVYVPPAIEMTRLGLTAPPPLSPVSPLLVIANMCQFYRGDLVVKKPDPNNPNFVAPEYYTEIDSLNADFYVNPYVCNLRYNEVAPTPTTGPAGSANRLENASFFYPWYPIRANISTGTGYFGVNSAGDPIRFSLPDNDEYLETQI